MNVKGGGNGTCYKVTIICQSQPLVMSLLLMDTPQPRPWRLQGRVLMGLVSFCPPAQSLVPGTVSVKHVS